MEEEDTNNENYNDLASKQETNQVAKVSLHAWYTNKNDFCWVKSKSAQPL